MLCESIVALCEITLHFAEAPLHFAKALLFARARFVLCYEGTFYDGGDMILFVEYPKCTTCQKAKAWLEAKGVSFTARHIKENPPTRAELAMWWQQSKLPLKRFFNTSGLLYKSLGLSTKLATMSEDEQLDLLATDGMLVKRPLLVTPAGVFPGFKPELWETLLCE